MKELLKRIGITAEGEYTRDGAYVIDILDYNEYGRYFSLLEKSELEEVQDTSQITLHTTNVTYASEDFQFCLQADLDEDLYKLVITQF